MVSAPAHTLEAPAAVSSDAGRSYTLPSRYYLDPALYEREKEAIFYRSWHYAAHRSQLAAPGDYRSVQVADESVFIIADDDGELRGFFNVCRHRAHQLVQERGGRVRGNIVCPYHAWSYSKRGALEFARNSEHVAGFDKGDFCLAPIAVEELCGLVFVNLDVGTPAMSQVYPGLAEDLRQHVPMLDSLKALDEVSFGPATIRANWKVVVDNFLECYHCTPAHPAFADMFDMGSYRLDSFQNWSRQLGPVTRPTNSAYDFDPDATVQTGGFWYLWPATTLNLLPGEPNLSPLSILPVDIQTTAFTGHRCALGASEHDPRWSYIDEVLGPEDTALCESVQKGLRSRAYDRGRLMVDPQRSGIGEHAVHQFHQLVLQAL